MTRLYLGKLNNVNQADLYKIVQTYGTVVDFLVKEKYAFVVIFHYFFLYLFFFLKSNMAERMKHDMPYQN